MCLGTGRIYVAAGTRVVLNPKMSDLLQLPSVEQLKVLLTESSDGISFAIAHNDRDQDEIHIRSERDRLIRWRGQGRDGQSTKREGRGGRREHRRTLNRAASR